MSGRLIGPENSGLKCRKFGTCFGQSTNCLGGLYYNLCNKLWFRCCWAENNHGFWFHKVEPMLGERVAHGQPTARLGTVKNSPDLLKCPCVFAYYCLKMNGSRYGWK